MNGSRFFILVLLAVFAIPLFADHTLVNPVSEAISNSTINSEEVPFTDQELFDNNVPILAVGIRKEHIRYMIGLQPSTPIEKTDIRNITNTIHGGIKRTNLRKH